MKNWRTLTAVAASVALLAGCTTNPYTGEQQAGKVGVYDDHRGRLLRPSSKKDRKKGALIGAAVGGLPAGGYGAYVDQQEAKLRQTLVNSGVQVQRQGDNLILIMPGNITFASSSADISASFYDTLNSLVLVFKEFNKNGIQIVGHTDSTGSLQLNQTLSNNRARSVANYLTTNGIAANRISAYGAGPNQPIASNDSAAGRQQNRRVEITLLPPQQ